MKNEEEAERKVPLGLLLPTLPFTKEARGSSAKLNNPGAVPKPGSKLFLGPRPEFQTASMKLCIFCCCMRSSSNFQLLQVANLLLL